MYYFYVLQNEVQEYYTGYTSNLERRLEEHNAGKNESTKGHQWRYVYYEAYVNESYARKREKTLKKNRRMKEFLLERVKESLSY